MVGDGCFTSSSVQRESGGLCPVETQPLILSLIHEKKSSSLIVSFFLIATVVLFCGVYESKIYLLLDEEIVRKSELSKCFEKQSKTLKN